MTRREEVDDWREFRRNHPGKWWKYHSRVWRSINIRAVAIAYCEQGFEIIPLWPCSKSPSIPSPHEWDSPECGTKFYARADAKYCTSRCKQRAYHRRRRSNSTGARR